MKSLTRAFLIVLDGVGIGALPDADAFGDAGSHTLLHTAQAVGGLCLPTLQRLGLGNLVSIPGVPPAISPTACRAKMAELSPGKDTILGHWELLGVVTDRPLPVYPNGFPPEVIAKLEQAWGRKIIGNCPASGTVIIEQLGPEHLRTGHPIVYTSADSVLQVAAHEEIIPPEELYSLCRKAREIMTGLHAVGRIIARPFIGGPGSFKRTPRRKDFSLPPPRPTVLRWLREASVEVAAVGKVADILAHQDIDTEIAAAGNRQVMDAVAEIARSHGGRVLVIANLVDFDTLYGHRNNPSGMARALEEFDGQLASLLQLLRPGDLLIITADHGCDPTTPSTDHSREYVPLLAMLAGAAHAGQRRELPIGGCCLGVRQTFADVAATLADGFNLEPWPAGCSFWPEVSGD